MKPGRTGTLAALAFATAALAPSAPAAAATLVLYDYSVAFGPDPADDPYVEQKIRQQIDSGILQPLRAPIADSGVPLTTKVQIFGASIPYTRPGTQIQTGEIYWLVTTGVEDGMLRWQIEIDHTSGYVGGYMAPSNVRSNQEVISGRGRWTDSPIVHATFTQSGKTHVVIGYVEP